MQFVIDSFQHPDNIEIKILERTTAPVKQAAHSINSLCLLFEESSVAGNENKLITNVNHSTSYIFSTQSDISLCPKY